MKYIRQGMLQLMAAVFLSAVILPPLVIEIRSGRGELISRSKGDIARSYLHWREYGFGALRSGRVPFWTPHVFCGSPFAANPEVALFYPLNLVHWFVSPVPAINLSLMFHLWLTGFTMWILARGIGLGILSALLSAVVFMLCGINFPRVFEGHLSNICTVAWIPLVTLAVIRILSGSGRHAIAGGALALAMMALAGHVQYTYYAVFFCGLLAVGSTILNFAEESLLERLLRLFRCLVMVLLGFAMAAVQLALTYANIAETGRRHLPYEYCSSWSLPIECLQTLWVPGLFGPGTDLLHWGPLTSWETCIYLGVIPLGLALVAIVRGLDRFESEDALPARAGPSPDGRMALTVWLAGAGLVSLVLALGRNTPLFALFYTAIPGFGLFRGASKLMVPVSLAGALLSGIGFQSLLDRPLRTTGRNRVLAGGLVILAILVGPAVWLERKSLGEFLMLVNPLDEHGDAGVTLPRTALLEPGQLDVIRRNAWTQVSRSIVVLGIGVLLLGGIAIRPGWKRWLGSAVLLLVAVELVLFDCQFVTSFKLADARAPEALITTIGARNAQVRALFSPPNSALTANLLCPLGYGAAVSYPLLIGALVNASNQFRQDLLLTHLMLQRRSKVEKAMGVAFMVKGEKISPIPGALERVRVFSTVRRLSTDTEIWDVMATERWDPQTELLVLDSLKPDRSAGQGGAPSPGQAWIESDRGEVLVAGTDLSQAAYLYLADTYSNHWSATVDGKPARIERANYAFRAVALPAGRHTVCFEYTPPGWRWGVPLSCAGLMITLGLLVWPTRS